ncbi:MAG: response regulator [Planctomycetota bacterium]|nr:response regulator [Planctomycetota bacterium]
MRIENLTPSHVRRAIEIYQEKAWPSGPPGNSPVDMEQVAKAQTIQELTEAFERPKAEDQVSCERYTLRLGNWRYPFMKFVMQEYLVEDEFFFSVDTHDDLRVDPSMPDYGAWCELRELNRVMKERIEAAWFEEGLPTYDDLRQLTEEIARIERAPGARAHILLVDDERAVARGLGALLTARGFTVQLAHDGRRVLEMLELDPLPDLVIMDYAMPELDGWQVLEQLRSDPRTKDLKVLLATATNIELQMLQRCNALLKKPYPRQMLFDLIDQLLGKG